MIQVQSTWFPLYDRNPQKFVTNIFRARDADYIPVTQRVFRSRRYPSHVTLPISTRAGAGGKPGSVHRTTVVSGGGDD
ncbi:MAG: hypothetical protein H0T77_16155 [Pyrinomonadaceae bacterium]|nr:hypothetical protein [Pyrinomonadaceae bacterium]